MRAEQGELELELEGQERRGPRVGLGDGSVQRIHMTARSCREHGPV